MKQVDEIIYDAIKADTDLMTAIGGRVVSTCFEVPPDSDDNTPIPYIIITDDGSQNQPETKDAQWDGCEDHVQVSIEVSGESPKQVRYIINRCRKAVAAYVKNLSYTDRPQLDALKRDGIYWDWTKPCYFDTLHYQCFIYN